MEFETLQKLKLPILVVETDYHQSKIHEIDSWGYWRSMNAYTSNWSYRSYHNYEKNSIRFGISGMAKHNGYENIPRYQSHAEQDLWVRLNDKWISANDPEIFVLICRLKTDCLHELR